MCLQVTAVRPHQKWNWAGDEIVHHPVIPASRTVPGTSRRRYPVDVREFLTTSSNAVIHDALASMRAASSVEDQARLTSSSPGSFDFRARRIVKFLAEQVRYTDRGRLAKDWLFPDEALAAKQGDCEDLAFLLAAMLIASGISSYCVRVAFGSLVVHGPTPARFGHAWVVYQNELGAWEILEPSARRAPTRAPRRASRRRTPAAELKNHHDVEYVPHFVLNDRHLWRVRTNDMAASRPLDDYVAGRRFWDGFDPSFAASLHENILDEALAGMSESDLDAVKRTSFWVDVNVLSYDPRDHFDFAYIDEGWSRVLARLATGELDDFALAAHAIGDFYAHSFYGDFAPRRRDGTIPPYDPAQPLDPSCITYDFEPYAPLPGSNGSVEAAAAHWNGKLISGQWWRWFTTFPSDLKKNAADLQWRRCLPDHDLVAVDSPDRKPGHKHFDEAEYAIQFAIRRAAAVEHVRDAYRGWSGRTR